MNRLKYWEATEKEKKYSLSAVEAEKRFDAACPCIQHPYLATKGVQAHGVRLEGGNLLVGDIRKRLMPEVLAREELQDIRHGGMRLIEQREDRIP